MTAIMQKIPFILITLIYKIMNVYFGGKPRIMHFCSHVCELAKKLILFVLQETHSVVEVLNGKLSEAFINQVQFTFSCNCFEPEKTKNLYLVTL